MRNFFSLPLVLNIPCIINISSLSAMRTAKYVLSICKLSFNFAYGDLAI